MADSLISSPTDANERVVFETENRSPWCMDDFRVLSKRFSSAASSVSVVTERRSGEQYAMKRIKKSKVLRYHLVKQVERELLIHQNLSHRNIVSVYAWFHDRDSIFMVLEKGEASLADLLVHKYPCGMAEKMVKRVCMSVLNGLVYLHWLNIIHRDLKPSNMLLVEKGGKYVVKIGDFGCAVHTTPEALRRTVCGSSPYIAPEIVEGVAGYSFGVDIWSFGVSVHELLSGSLPFDGQTPMEVYRKIVKDAYMSPQGTGGFFQSLLSACMQKDVTKRSTSVDLRRNFFAN